VCKSTYGSLFSEANAAAALFSATTVTSSALLAYTQRPFSQLFLCLSRACLG
jgi:hypothetical protein